ncbi:4416_t:CDS:1, partial [Funneliformis mosseae]
LKDLMLDDNDLKIIRKQKIASYAFLQINKEKLYTYEMLGGLVLVLADFTKKVKKKKLKYTRHIEL